jgi:hypothetical protein
VAKQRGATLRIDRRDSDGQDERYGELGLESAERNVNFVWLDKQKQLYSVKWECTRAIRKVTSGELLTKQTVRKKIIMYKKYVHN